MKISALRLLPICLALAALPALADEAQEIGKLIKQGQSTQAVDRANQYLVKFPKDAQVRFAKGLALAELGKSSDAIKVFQALTEDFPDLPEPYNNLAVLYAQQKQFDKARQALQMAIQTHPSYATAHENLGDIYAEMASQAYSKALQLDKGNANAQIKLTMVRELFSRKSGGGKIAPAADPVKLATIAPVDVSTKPVTPPPVKPVDTTTIPVAKPVDAKSVENKLPDASKTADAAAKPAIKVADAKAKPDTATKPADTKTKPDTTAKADAKPDTKPVADTPRDSKPVVRAVESWAQAWSGQRVSSYLSAYGKDFHPPKGLSRKDWESERKDRISAPKSIAVGINEPSVTFIDDKTAKVTFSQSYKSDALKSVTPKTLVLSKSGDRWVIIEERVGR